ncbi:MAG: hypothetical protein V1495_06135 [Pseudomonadota bacterium]
MDRSVRRNQALVLGLGLLVSIWLVHLFALPWSRDEGLYLVAAHELRRGFLPHLDFFYEQMPLYLPILSGWGALFGGSLIAGRFLSFFSLIFLGTGVWFYLRKSGVSPWDRLACLWILFGHPLSWVCFPIVKPHALAMALVLWSFVLVDRAGEKMEGARTFAFGSGLLSGGAGNIRLLFALPALIVGIRARKTGQLRSFLFGCLVPCIPSLILFCMSPDVVGFNWIGYHRLRGVWQTRGIVHQLVSFGWSFSGAHWLLLLPLLAMAVWIWSKKKRGLESVLGLFLAGLLMAIGSIRLVPFYPEYVLPVWVFTLVAVVARIGADSRGRKILSLVGICAAVWSLFPVVEDLKWIAGGDGTSSVNDRREVHAVGEAIQELTCPDDEVLSWWNGYLVESGRRFLPGMNQGFVVTKMEEKLTPEQVARYRIATVPQIVRWIENGRPALVVTGLDTPAGFEPLLKGRYRPVREVGGARLYVRFGSRSGCP